ncbi:MAG: hypothetical protein GY862_12310 [Gammaproteobacteria bacterium]|nr:hypothetical protein [Gammaproteobacteria bacterium]
MPYFDNILGSSKLALTDAPTHGTGQIWDDQAARQPIVDYFQGLWVSLSDVGDFTEQQMADLHVALSGILGSIEGASYGSGRMLDDVLAENTRGMIQLDSVVSEILESAGAGLADAAGTAAQTIAAGVEAEIDTVEAVTEDALAYLAAKKQVESEIADTIAGVSRMISDVPDSSRTLTRWGKVFDFDPAALAAESSADLAVAFQDTLAAMSPEALAALADSLGVSYDRILAAGLEVIDALRIQEAAYAGYMVSLQM